MGTHTRQWYTSSTASTPPGGQQHLSPQPGLMVSHTVILQLGPSSIPVPVPLISIAEAVDDAAAADMAVEVGIIISPIIPDADMDCICASHWVERRDGPVASEHAHHELLKLQNPRCLDNCRCNWKRKVSSLTRGCRAEL